MGKTLRGKQLCYWYGFCSKGYVCSEEPQSVWGERPRDVTPGLAGVIVLET